MFCLDGKDPVKMEKQMTQERDGTVTGAVFQRHWEGRHPGLQSDWSQTGTRPFIHLQKGRGLVPELI